MEPATLPELFHLKSTLCRPVDVDPLPNPVVAQPAMAKVIPRSSADVIARCVISVYLASWEYSTRPALAIDVTPRAAHFACNQARNRMAPFGGQSPECLVGKH